VRTIDVPGRPSLQLEHLLLDVNGTLTNRGELIDEVVPRLRALQQALDVHLLSADTFGSLARVASTLGARARVVRDGTEKVAVVRELGPQHCVAVGNGANDEGMLAEAALGIAVVGPEGAALTAAMAAQVLCSSIVDALDLLLDDRAIVATLRP
jgi:P-type E1-E2 ATPase